MLNYSFLRRTHSFLACLMLTTLCALLFLFPVSAETESGEIDETLVYQNQIIERADNLYRSLARSHGGGQFTDYIQYTSTTLNSYESSLRNAALYNDYKDTMISYTEAFCDVCIGFLKADVGDMIGTARNMLIEEATKGVLPKVTVDQFIYAQAREGGEKVTISGLWDFKDKYEETELGFETYDDAVNFIVAVQGNKIGMAALKMGKDFYMDQLNESSWSFALGIAKDLLVSQVLSFLPDVDWFTDYMGGYAFTTLIDGIETLATESDNPFILQWKEDIEAINRETEYLLRLDTSDPALYPAHTVYFEPNGGSVSRKSMTVHETCPYGSMPWPYRFGYTFNGWYDDPEGGTRYSSSSRYALETDQTLYAHWTHTVLDEGTCGDDLTWILYGDGILEVFGSGEMINAPWLTEWRECIGEVILPEGLTSICDYAFDCLFYVTEITLPSSLQKIGDYAFARTGLQSLTLPEGVSKIGRGILYGNEGVKTLTFPTSLETTGYGAGAYDTTWEESVEGSEEASGETPEEAVYDFTFDMNIGVLTHSGVESVTFKYGTATVLHGICSNALSLSSVSIPGTVVTLEEKCFAGCPLLKSIYLPDSIRTIDYAAFGREKIEWYSRSAEASEESSVSDPYVGGESGLTSLTLPSRVRRLGFSILQGNKLVRTLDIPGSVTDAMEVTEGSAIETVRILPGMTIMPEDMLGYGAALRSVSLPAGLKEIGRHAFQYTGLQSLTLPEGLETIGGEILYNCTGVTKLTIPSSVTRMCDGENEYGYNASDRALYGSSIRELTFAEGTESIPAFACTETEGLETLILPSGVRSIGDEAFENCYSLSVLSYVPAQLPEIGMYAFSGTSLPPMLLVPEHIDLEFEDLNSGLDVYPYLISSSWDPRQDMITAGGVDWQFTEEGILFEIEDGLLVIRGNGTTDVTCSFSGGSASFEVTASGLRMLTLPAGVTEIEEEAFAGLNVHVVELPEGLKKIGPGAFRDCTDLLAINYPDSLVEVGDEAFAGCDQVAIYNGKLPWR